MKVTARRPSALDGSELVIVCARSPSVRTVSTSTVWKMTCTLGNSLRPMLNFLKPFRPFRLVLLLVGLSAVLFDSYIVRLKFDRSHCHQHIIFFDRTGDQQQRPLPAQVHRRGLGRGSKFSPQTGNVPSVRLSLSSHHGKARFLQLRNGSQRCDVTVRA